MSVYKNNPRLKACNVPIEWSLEMLQEYDRCKSDPVYFTENYVKIISVDDGVIPFKMYDFQKEMMKAFHGNRHTICKLPRQVGKSTVSVAYMLHYMLFNEAKTVAILANKGSTAREILSRLKMAFELLPAWLQQGVRKWNEGSIEFENNSEAIAGSTSSSAIRGLSISLLFLDEFAFLPSNQASQFFESVYPTISSGKETKMIIVSTPKGLNLFYRMFIDASENRSEFKAMSINWWDMPGRDEEWKRKTISTIGEESFAQEFACIAGETKITVYDEFEKKIKRLTIDELYREVKNGCSLQNNNSSNGEIIYR